MAGDTRAMIFVGINQKKITMNFSVRVLWPDGNAIRTRLLMSTMVTFNSSRSCSWHRAGLCLVHIITSWYVPPYVARKCNSDIWNFKLVQNCQRSSYRHETKWWKHMGSTRFFFKKTVWVKHPHPKRLWIFHLQTKQVDGSSNLFNINQNNAVYLSKKTRTSCPLFPESLNPTCWVRPRVCSAMTASMELCSLGDPKESHESCASGCRAYPNLFGPRTGPRGRWKPCRSTPDKEWLASVLSIQLWSFMACFYKLYKFKFKWNYHARNRAIAFTWWANTVEGLRRVVLFVSNMPCCITCKLISAMPRRDVIVNCVRPVKNPWLTWRSYQSFVAFGCCDGMFLDLSARSKSTSALPSLFGVDWSTRPAADSEMKFRSLFHNKGQPMHSKVMNGPLYLAGLTLAIQGCVCDSQT